MIDYQFLYVSLQNLSFIWKVTFAGETPQNLGLCSALRAFEEEGIFIVSHLLWPRVSIFPVPSEELPHSVPLTTRKGILRTYSNLYPHGSPCQKHARDAEDPFTGSHNRKLFVSYTTRLKLAATKQQPIRPQKLAANKENHQRTESTHR